MVEEETNISFRIDKNTYNKLKKLADKDNRSLANYLRTIIKKIIEKEGNL